MRHNMKRFALEHKPGLAFSETAIRVVISFACLGFLTVSGWCQQSTTDTSQQPPVVPGDADEPASVEPPEEEMEGAEKKPAAEVSSNLDGSANDDKKGIQFFAPRHLDMQFGMRFEANDNFCSQLFATVAFPIDWPEQKVTIRHSYIPANAAWKFRDLPINSPTTNFPTTARQLMMTIPVLQPNGALNILFDVEIEKSFINPPEDTTLFRIPKKIAKELNWHVGNSPMIDASASDIKRIAKSIKESQPANAWAHVEMIYDWVRNNIEYRNGPIRNTRDAMKDKKGDCEEMSGIFIALCRASGIPARCVWIPEHCYPEFYLEDDEGKGHWFPCQVAGDRQFGQMHDYRPILQKGDRFKVPENQGMEHYVSQFFKCQRKAIGPREPNVEPVLDLGPLQQEIDALQAEVRGRRE